MSQKFGQKAKVNGVIYLRMEGVLATLLGHHVSRIIVNVPMQRKPKCIYMIYNLSCIKNIWSKLLCKM